jgi:hypothetical protein
MVFLLVLVIGLSVVAGSAFVLGAGLIGVILVVLGLLALVWIVWAFAGSRSPGAAIRETHPVELLGPGGPDDPDRTASHGR